MIKQTIFFKYTLIYIIFFNLKTLGLFDFFPNWKKGNRKWTKKMSNFDLGSANLQKTRARTIN